MTWADNLTHDNETQNFFVRASARLRVLPSLWTLYSGAVYQAAFNYGPVTSLKINSVAYTLGTSPSLSAGQYYHDRDAGVLYVRHSSGTALTSTNLTVVPVFYLFYSMRECLWYQTPDDDTTPTVLWKGILKNPPEYKVTLPANGLGFYPNDPSILTIMNDQSLNYIIKEGSFNRTPCEVWQQVGKLEVENIEPVLSGIFGQNIQVGTKDITFQVLDKSFDFDAVVAGSYFSGTVNPKFQGTPFMKIWGDAGNNYDNVPVFELCALDYNTDAPTTSNNRKYGLVKDTDARYAQTLISGTMRSGGTDQFLCNTTTDEGFFRAGDRIWFDGVADQYLTVDALIGGGQISFTTPPTGGANQSGDIRISFIKRVFLIKEGIKPIELLPGRDWQETLHTGDIRGITLTSTAEANAGTSTIDPAIGDMIFAVVTGQKTRPTFGGNPLTDTTEFDNIDGYNYKEVFSQGINVLYSFLKDECGLAESSFDFPSFTAAKTVCSWSVFLPLPMAQLTEFPQMRDILDVLLRSMLCRAYFDRDGKLTLRPHTLVETADFDVAKEEVIDSSYNIDYSNLSNLKFVRTYELQSFNRVAFTGTKADFMAGTAQLKFLENVQVNKVNEATNGVGYHLHQQSKNTIFEHLVSVVRNGGADDYERFTTRTAALYGTRTLTRSTSVRRQHFGRDVGDIASITEPDIIGHEYDGVEASEKYEVIEIAKSEDSVSMVLDDNKAAQDLDLAGLWD